MTPARTRCAWLWPALITVALAVGCGDEETGTSPEVPAGRISGTVRTGLPTPGLRIRATRIPEGGQSIFIGEATPEPSGDYTLDVAAGNYVIGLVLDGRAFYSYTRNGLRYATEPGDTVRVDETHSLSHIDFDLSTMRVRMDLPRELEGEYGTVRLIRREDVSEPSRYTDVNRGSALIKTGELLITVPCVLPGSYKMQMTIGGGECGCIGVVYGGESFWLPSQRDSSQTAWTDVPMGQVVDVAGQLDSQPARIEGEVLGAWQDLPVVDRPAVALFTPDSLFVRGFWTVDEDGAFGLDVFLVTPVKVCVSHDGFIQWIGGGGFDEAQTFALERGATLSGLRLLQSGLLVTIEPDSVGTIFMDVRIYDARSGSETGRYQPSESGGRHVIPIPNLRPGEYLLRLAPRYLGWEDWLEQWYDGASSRDGARVITIAREGEVVPVDVRLETGGNITGTILDAGVTDHAIYFTTADDPGSHFYVPVHSATYDVAGLPDGSYKVGASRRTQDQSPWFRPSATVWYPGTTDWNAAEPITISDHGIVSGVDITISR